MRLDKRYRIERVASPDEYRRHISQAYLDVEAKRIVATNGHVLVAVPVETTEADRSGHLPAAACRAARVKQHQEHRKPPQPHPVTARKRLLVCGEALYRRREAAFPSWREVMPKFNRGDTGTVTIGIDPRLLMLVAEALGAGQRGGLALTVKLTDGKPGLDVILVEHDGHLGPDEAVAALMPRRLP